MKYQNSTYLFYCFFDLNFKILFLSILIFVMCSNTTYSNSELFPNAFSIDSVSIVSDTSLYVGDTIQLQFKFKSFVEAAGYYELSTSGGFRILQNNEMVDVIKDTLTYDTNLVTKNYLLIIDSITKSEFIFRTVITDEVSGVNLNDRFQIQAEPIGNYINLPVYEVDGCTINERNLEINLLDDVRIFIVTSDILGIQQVPRVELKLNRGCYSFPLKLLIPEYTKMYLLNIILVTRDNQITSKNFKILK